MIIVDLAQGTEEWTKEKLGKPSASNASKIITNEGKVSKQRDAYLYELAAEIILGKHQNGAMTAAMEDGITREQEARDCFSMLNDVEIQQGGLIYRDEGRRVLCSPDGIINGSKGLEIKNPLAKTQVKYLIDDDLPSEYFGQVQFSLFVTGFKVWQFFTYCPGLKPFQISVLPDPAYQAALEIEIPRFIKELDAIVKKIK